MDKENISHQTSAIRHRKRVYISGPMTGLTRREFMRRFAVAEVTLARLGYEPVNPARFLVCKPWLFRLIGYRITLIYDLWRLSRCDAVAYLPNWTASPGANVEHRYATSAGIPELPEQLKVWCAVENDIQDRAIKARTN